MSKGGVENPEKHGEISEDINNLSGAIKALRLVRETSLRLSNSCINLWEKHLQPQTHENATWPGSANEKWLLFEQLAFSALDTGNLPLAESLIEALSFAFPKSKRVERLNGMKLEANKHYADALNVYESRILNDDPTNALACKRKVAVLKAQGKSWDAIAALCKHVDKFAADVEAWQELYFLYLDEGQHSKAAFCLEELILVNPFNHLWFCFYGEVKYTEGDPEKARAYFAYALALNDGNTRALYGFFLASRAASSRNPVMSRKYANWAARSLVKRYEVRAAPEHAKMVQQLLSEFSDTKA